MVKIGDSNILKFIKSEAKNITVHDLLKKIHDDHLDNAEESAELKYSEEIFPVFPKLSCPFKLKRWTWDVARKDLLAYFHVLGFRQESQPDLPRKMMTFKHKTTIYPCVGTLASKSARLAKKDDDV